MEKDIEMRLATIFKYLRKFAGGYVSELENGSLAVPEAVFAINKLVEYCDRNDGREE